MDDYISRNAAIRAMRGEPEDRTCSFGKPVVTTSGAEYRLRNLPTADVAPVIRCKDCRWYALKRSSICDMHRMAVLSSDYCSYAVRKEA